MTGNDLSLNPKAKSKLSLNKNYNCKYMKLKKGGTD